MDNKVRDEQLNNLTKQLLKALFCHPLDLTPTEIFGLLESVKLNLYCNIYNQATKENL